MSTTGNTMLNLESSEKQKMTDTEKLLKSQTVVIYTNILKAVLTEAFVCDITPLLILKPADRAKEEKRWSICSIVLQS